MRLLLLLAALLVGCGGKTTPDAASDELVFGLLPTESSTDAERRWAPLLERLSTVTGKTVKPLKVVDYAALVEALRFGKADLAYLGPKTYVLARERAGVQPLAQEIPMSGQSTYRGLIVTAASHAANDLEGLKGSTFAFVDPNSTSGYLVPLVHFVEELKTEPEEYFAEVRYAGSHQAVLLQVRLGHVDAGATNELDLARAIEGGDINADEIKTVWTSDPIPGSPIVARKDLPPELLAQVRNALVDYKDPEGLKRMQSKGFVEVTDANYEPVRRLQRLREARGK
ncbi:MAG: phosphate/phosphite/phosphonate ABC transporter substrate-binding protein [Deltaproteobacteria bacterium]|nr:phosphate/phosphite/phosphonate ABC transporter substrate-binding protein [Deltaproteobacteria bacterium]